MARAEAHPSPWNTPAPSGFSSALADRLRGAGAVIILPTLNQEGGLARALAELRRHLLDAPDRRVQILVLDGGSTDGTLEVALAAGIPAVRPLGRGKGAAVLETIVWAQAHGIENAVVLDADASYPTDRVLDALELLDQSADLVVGVRRSVSGPAERFQEATHRAGNVGLSHAKSLLSGPTICDLSSGFWGVSTQRFVDLGLEGTYFATGAEMVLEAVCQGLRVVQLPVECRERVGGGKLRAVGDGSRILRTILGHGRPAPTRPGTPRPETSHPPTKLTSFGLFTASRTAVVECAPHDSATASDHATLLRPNVHSAVVRGDPSGPPQPPRPPATTGPGPTPMVISRSVGGAPRTEASATAGCIGSPRRPLTIERASVGTLPAPDRGRPLGVTPGSRGWKSARNTPRSPRFPSLQQLVSRIGGRVEWPRAMLPANGFYLVERGQRVLRGMPGPQGEV